MNWRARISPRSCCLRSPLFSCSLVCVPTRAMWAKKWQSCIPSPPGTGKRGRSRRSCASLRRLLL
ncbi:MAG: hypothetical protein MZV64_59760 [Ignavibacteriales bacterium]|nr:hypothetical protein [Ignavibacteriales bacterium]